MTTSHLPPTSSPTPPPKKKSTLPAWATRDYRLRPDYRLFGLACVFVLLPNVFFLLGAYFVGVARPLVNVDYVWACLLLALPYRFLRVIGAVLFVLTALLDVMMMAMQLFPFLDVAAIISLAPFLWQAPVRYMLLLGLACVFVALMLGVLWRLGRGWFGTKKSWLTLLAVSAMTYLAYDRLHEFKYRDFWGERFAQSDYYYIHSQYSRYLWVADSEFASYFGQTPQILPVDIAYISHHFGVKKTGITEPTTRPLITADTPADAGHLGDKGVSLGEAVVRMPSDKMLLIIAESWGVARDPKVQKEILAGVYRQADHLEFLDTGYFGFSGATVEGELRELCQADVEGGYAFNRLADDALRTCLPHRLKAQGYETLGMHAGFSAIYERNYLYPKMGFAKTIFAGDINDKKRCSPFNGICDSELFTVVADNFAKHDKLFYYWLTLTSHSPYATKDIYNTRFDCAYYAIPKGDICNNYRLHTQFFDDLGALIANPKMAGVEVIVVGDHMPPIISKTPLHPYLQWQDVSWLHFKIKG